MIEFFTENAEFLLGRPTRSVIDAEIKCYFENKCVLVTGGGGTIGSELCRAVAGCGAKRIVILDINENNAHDVYESLSHTFPEAEVRIAIASVREAERMKAVFSRCKPDVVLHAAAHKHVLLMEADPSEAVKNNILGTLNCADAAEAYGASRFVLISTDKAVEPESVMGATKRFCEYIISSRRDSKTVFSAVRFGNVLGSAGSVLPDFYRLINRGEVLKITHPEVERYFMSVAEAAELVLSAAAKYGEGVCVLDMGEPVRIATLAKRLGELLSRDVMFEYTSLGAGEKLAERLCYETLPKTEPYIWREEQAEITRSEIAHRVNKLTEVLGDDEAIKRVLHEVVSEYR